MKEIPARLTIRVGDDEVITANDIEFGAHLLLAGGAFNFDKIVCTKRANVNLTDEARERLAALSVVHPHRSLAELVRAAVRMVPRTPAAVAA